MRRAWLDEGNRTAMIIPAFERIADTPAADQQRCAASVQDVSDESECWMYSQYDVPLTRAVLTRMVEVDKTAGGFFSARVCPRIRLPSVITCAFPFFANTVQLWARAREHCSRHVTQGALRCSGRRHMDATTLTSRCVPLAPTALSIHIRASRTPSPCEPRCPPLMSAGAAACSTRRRTSPTWRPGALPSLSTLPSS